MAVIHSGRLCRRRYNVSSVIFGIGFPDAVEGDPLVCFFVDKEPAAVDGSVTGKGKSPERHHIVPFHGKGRIYGITAFEIVPAALHPLPCSADLMTIEIGDIMLINRAAFQFQRNIFPLGRKRDFFPEPDRAIPGNALSLPAAADGHIFPRTVIKVDIGKSFFDALISGIRFGAGDLCPCAFHGWLTVLPELRIFFIMVMPGDICQFFKFRNSHHSLFTDPSLSGRAPP